MIYFHWFSVKIKEINILFFLYMFFDIFEYYFVYQQLFSSELKKVKYSSFIFKNNRLKTRISKTNQRNYAWRIKWSHTKALLIFTNDFGDISAITRNISLKILIIQKFYSLWNIFIKRNKYYDLCLNLLIKSHN